MPELTSPECSSQITRSETAARLAAAISTVASITTIVTAILAGIVGITMIIQRVWKMLM